MEAASSWKCAAILTLDSLHTLRLLEKSKDFGPWATNESIDQYLSDFWLKNIWKGYFFCENSAKLSGRVRFSGKMMGFLLKVFSPSIGRTKTGNLWGNEQYAFNFALENRSSAVTGVVESLKKNEENSRLFSKVFALSTSSECLMPDRGIRKWLFTITCYLLSRKWLIGKKNKPPHKPYEIWRSNCPVI